MSRKPRLLDELREELRKRHYSYRTEKQYVAWVRRYILFQGKRHPVDLGGPEIEAYLSHLATDRKVAAATQAQALAAILFLYKRVLNVTLPWLVNVTRARRPKRLPVVLSRCEFTRWLDQLINPYWLIASLFYGSGLRLLEAVRLRVKDIDVAQRRVLVRDGKGMKDRVTMLPEKLVRRISIQVRQRHCVVLAL